MTNLVCKLYINYTVSSCVHVLVNQLQPTAMADNLFLQIITLFLSVYTVLYSSSWYSISELYVVPLN